MRPPRLGSSLDVLRRYREPRPPSATRPTRCCGPLDRSTATSSAAALLDGRIAGPATHPLDNVRGNAQMLIDRDPDKEFGLTGLPGGIDLDGILDLVEAAAGAPIDREARYGPVQIDPEAILDACGAVGPRLARASRSRRAGRARDRAPDRASRTSTCARQLADRWRRRRDRALRRRTVAGGTSRPRLGRRVTGRGEQLTDGREPRHTHWPVRDAPHAGRRDARPGARRPRLRRRRDRGGVETLSIADVNDPALLVARAQGRTDHVLVFDDHVEPEATGPCFQAIAARS